MIIEVVQVIVLSEELNLGQLDLAVDLVPDLTPLKETYDEDCCHRYTHMDWVGGHFADSLKPYISSFTVLCSLGK